jgi:hypothetical protein
MTVLYDQGLLVVKRAMVRPGFFFGHALPHDPQDAHTRTTLSDVCKLPILMCRIQFGVLAPRPSKEFLDFWPTSCLLRYYWVRYVICLQTLQLWLLKTLFFQAQG